jgi:glycosyltransferase involved in cell wall biosynthesis
LCLHVIHYVPNFYDPTGGRETFVYGLVLGLEKCGITQSVITNSTASKQVGITKHSESITVYSLGSRRLGAYRVLDGVFDIFRRNKYDLINIHGYAEYTGDVTCILKILHSIKTPLILTTHGIAGLKHAYLALDFSFPLSISERIARIFHFNYDFTLGKMEMKTFDKVIVLSNEEKKYLHKLGLKKAKTVSIPIAVNDVFFSNPPDRKRNHILYVGRLDRYKGIDVLLRAISELKENGQTDISCLIIGKDVGYKNKIELLVRELNIMDSVTIRSELAQKDLVDIYSSAFVTVLPSSSEGFPLSLVESIASGTPFVATPVGGIPELVDTSKAGLLFSIGNFKELADKISLLHQNDQLWKEMSWNGRKAARNYSWNSVTKKYLQLYTNLMNEQAIS